MMLRAGFSRLIKRGTLEIVTARGRRLMFGDGAGEKVVIQFADPRAERELVINPELKFGELFTDGRLTVERGDVYDFLVLAMQGVREPDEFLLTRIADNARMAVSRIVPLNSAARARRNAAYHYDLGDDLFELFLDPDWQYSCAYFESPTQTLADAQRAKMRHIAAKLVLAQPGKSVLDIGCGWGGLALYLADISRVGTVVGVTLSDAQVARAQSHARVAGLSNIDFRLQDYRAVTGQFDRIVSVGMFEHVGLAHYADFFSTCRRLLSDDGVALLHTIGSPGPPGPTNAWATKYIFPGGHIPSLSDIVLPMERAGLVITDVETLGPHYALTLRAWRTAFLANRTTAMSLYDERFCRMWEYYLAASEVSFRTNDITLFQIQFAHRRENAPMTRRYIDEAEQALRGRERDRAGAIVS